MNVNKYPQHEAMKEINHLSQNVRDFLEFLADKGIELGQWETGSRDEFIPVYSNYDDLMYEFFEIDKEAFWKEKEAMLDEIRQIQD